VALALFAVSCSSGTVDVPVISVIGVVVDVDGDLVDVVSFTIVDETGVRRVLVPAEGLTFDGSPLSHLSAHVVSGDPVHIEYEEGSDGVLIAVRAEDA